MSTAAARVAHLMTERALQDAIVQVAKLHRWIVYHPFDSRHSTAGWPDLVLLRPPVAIFAELKRQDGKLSPQQAHMLEQLAECGLTTRVWRPTDLDDVIALLSAPQP